MSPELEPLPRSKLELNQGRRVGLTIPTLVGPKILLFMVKVLYFQSLGRTKFYQVGTLLKWSVPILPSFRRILGNFLISYVTLIIGNMKDIVEFAKPKLEPGITRSKTSFKS